MKQEDYFFNCSKEYIYSIDPNLYKEISEVLTQLPKRRTQAEINNDLFWLLTNKGWSYDTLSGISDNQPSELKIQNINKSIIEQNNNRSFLI